MNDKYMIRMDMFDGSQVVSRHVGRFTTLKAANKAFKAQVKPQDQVAVTLHMYKFVYADGGLSYSFEEVKSVSIVK